MGSGRAERRTVHILLVEDNPGDVRLVREALVQGQVAHTLAVAADGVEALDYLNQRGPHAASLRPDLILLDLNLPGRPGREVLAEIKRDPRFRSIPVVILSTSRAEADVLETYDQHANCYITKPADFDQFVQLIQTIEAFWLSVVELPNR